jgi:hypothetical protein
LLFALFICKNRAKDVKGLPIIENMVKNVKQKPDYEIQLKY